ncbi:nuclear transport factor 2 family protein [Flagellimonas sp. CMM7]|uniref:nuclear transport factor 2 family protein n=1 Tax=Flagellimonas sp. CMM7 TaxID=2654676 RepID=UPI0013CFE6B7|nr:nuclear transport factor 2 family protein [Flagellimonas sp. CMM7]UII78780.1 nuclear transport factor 2 family protein [Flagellimonas sp. CMM7]
MNKIDFKKFYQAHWTIEERLKLEVVTDFVQGILNHEFDQVIATYRDHPYVQHNRSVPSGIENIVNLNRKMASRFPEFFLDPKHVYLDGDFVIFHSHLTVKANHRGNEKKGLNVIDIWKISDGKIVEHWDSIQPLDFMSRLFTLITGGAIRNNDGVF